MKVKTMIEYLQEMNPDAEVRSGCHDGSPVLFVLTAMNLDDGVVWIESEDDIDLGNELEERFAYAVEECIDELDFYADLLEIGITVDTVCRYMGNETARHMEKFCKEHGLI